MLWWTLRQLKSESPRTRVKAAVKLAESNDPRAVEALVAALKDSCSDVSVAANKALRKIATPAFEPLLKALKHKDTGMRWRAADILGEIHDPRAVQPLIMALDDYEETVRESAAVALGRIADAGAVQALVRMVRREGGPARLRAAEALCRIGVPALEALLQALKEKDPRVREAVVVGLAGIQDTRAVGGLLTALTDNDADVRRAAMLFFDRFDPKTFCSALEALLQALKEKDPGVRKAAVWGLRGIHDTRAVGGLLTALTDNDAGVRGAAEYSLGCIDPNWRQWQSVKAIWPVRKDHMKKRVSEEEYKRLSPSDRSQVWSDILDLLQNEHMDSEFTYTDFPDLNHELGVLQSVLWELKEDGHIETSPGHLGYYRLTKKRRGFSGSEFAHKLRCQYCGKTHATKLWPENGDHVPFYFQGEPGKYTVEVWCPHCGKDWYVVWDQDPGYVRTLD